MAATQDSMFLFEIIVQDLKSCIDCKEFIIRSQFADVFNVYLKYPNESSDILTQRHKKWSKKKTKENKLKVGQEVILAYNIDMLISNMENYPLELSILRKEDYVILGLTHIQWSLNHINYLKKVCEQPEPSPVSVDGQYNIFHKITLKLLTTVKLTIKLSNLKDKLTNQINGNSFNLSTNMMTTLKDLSMNGTAEADMKVLNNTRKIELKNSPQQIESIHCCLKSNIMAIEKEKIAFPITVDEIDHNNKQSFENQQHLIHFIKSEASIDKNKNLNPIKTKSFSTIKSELAHILEDIRGGTSPYGNRVYCVSYFTSENDYAKDTGSSRSKSTYDNKTSVKKSDTGSCVGFVSTFDYNVNLKEATQLKTVNKCSKVSCNSKNRELPPKPDDLIKIDLTKLKKKCCNITQDVEDVFGEIKANVQYGNDPCMCTCECKFGFTKTSVNCTICGGYTSHPSQDNSRQVGHVMPFPCPIFHKMIENNKSKNLSTSGSDFKKRNDDNQKIIKAGSKKTVSDKVPESERDAQKRKKIKKDDRFKYNYGYKAPQNGHIHCTSPCTGTLGAVPKKMAWLWDSEDIPGMKFRPNWKPGATFKHVVRLLKIAKNPGKAIAKKRKNKDGEKMKKALKRPLLTVHKNDGEITVTMETMKVYSKQRSFNQYPYEDKPVLIYTIGRTDEENKQRQIKKQRKQRRLERSQRQYIQSTFKNMCNEVCLKTYQQALAILPDAENLDCSCYPAKPGTDKSNQDVSCSCSEDKSASSTDSDLDEWIVEFTPPNATYYPTFKGKKVSKIDSSTQYTYLDYKVKLLDNSGNPVPRFFKDPDGKQQCSDLGGFWSPDKKWLYINIDGYIGPDKRWAPNQFIGPNGERIHCDTGKFQDTDGTWLTVGVDGFIDSQGKWKYYRKPTKLVKKSHSGISKCDSSKKDGKNVTYKLSEIVWNCFGDVTPHDLSKIGIIGHGQDKKLLLDTLKEMLAKGQDVRIPEAKTVAHVPASKRRKKLRIYGSHYFHERSKCKHASPSDKGIVAVDEHGNKTYFRLKGFKNRRPEERLSYLTKQGISLNSFHLPCFRSFINREIMKKELYEKLQARYENSMCNSMQPAL